MLQLLAATAMSLGSVAVAAAAAAVTLLEWLPLTGRGERTTLAAALSMLPYAAALLSVLALLLSVPGLAHP